MACHMRCLFLLVIGFALTSMTESNNTNQVSLAFIIDTSGSMSIEMNWVKTKVKELLNSTDPTQIDYYIIVAFNDPFDSTKNIKSKNKTLIINFLDGLTASGGGDCPEYAFAGILKGIELASSNSHLIVFTDADPKDYPRFGEVVNAALAKSIKFYFVITGCCDGKCTTAISLFFQRIITSVPGKRYKLSVRSYVQYFLDMVVRLVRINRIDALIHSPSDYSEIISASEKDTLPASVSLVLNKGPGLYAHNFLVVAAVLVTAVWNSRH